MSFFFLMRRRPPRSTRTDTLFPYTTLFRCRRLLFHEDANRGAAQGGARRNAAAPPRASADRGGGDARRIGRASDLEARARYVDADGQAARLLSRSEERRVGKECVSTCRYWWSAYH